MNTTETILQVTGASYRAYDNYRHRMFIQWCHQLAERYRMSLQTLTRHDGLMNWYHDMWQLHVEKLFCIEMQDYFGVIEPDEADGFIYDYALEIESMEPRALLVLIQAEQQTEIPLL